MTQPQEFPCYPDIKLKNPMQVAISIVSIMFILGQPFTGLER